jgi:hypothetical protein
MKKVLAFLALTISYFLLTANVVLADNNQYGNITPSTGITIEKMVNLPAAKGANPTTLNYVNNLFVTDPRFHAGDDVNFRLRIKNTSNINIDVTVKDFITPHVSPSAGPGSFDSTNRIITFYAGTFTPNEERIFYITTVVNGENTFPSNSPFCEINRAQAHADNPADDSSSSQFCMEKITGATPTPTGFIITPVPGKGGVTTPNIPSTGPELGIVLFLSEVSMLGIGAFLKRRSK